MNALQQFIQSKPMGFLRDTDIPKLIALDRLCQVLVRCGGCRFTCSAQDVQHLIKCVEAGGDYVRDVSFPVGAFERASTYVPEQFRSEHPCPEFRNQTLAQWFDENDCGGVFDGNQVISDADSGL